MNALQEKTLRHFTGKDSAAEVDLFLLQQLAEQYPYFAPAQFFLASKFKQYSNAAASGQLTKTALYFNNPLWLQWQLESAPVKKDPASHFEKLAEPALDSLKHTMQAIDEADIVDHEPEEPASEQPDMTADAETQMDSRLSGLLNDQLADFKKPVSKNDKLEIEQEKEKLHTIDYFASQGIRIDLSKIPQDKLTSQLRKFTDWLKQMKNPNQPQSVDLGTSAEMENAVVEIAKTSNVSREVLTEAMAEVLVKQGQTDKAIQLFIKLSFINPEKSSYFAARIEQLKGIV